VSWTEDHQNGISWKNPGQNEHNHQGTEDRWEGGEDPSENVSPNVHGNNNVMIFDKLW
jgi:hypothetical protein